jgi:hypothetical protein
VLAGWTASGKRPEFDIVTGVSTGALTAPFAFLGPRYDDALKQVFTESNTKDIAIAQPIRGLLGGDSLASNAPLAKVIAYYVNDAFLREVAAEHLKGRRLLIGTTNLDAERPVIWGHGSDRCQRPALGARAVPHRAALLGGNPGRLSARLHQGRR